MVGVDYYNGSPADLRTFQSSTGASYPLLLEGNTAAGGNVGTLYGPNDSHFVVSKQGIVRLNTLKWPHGSRIIPHLTEIRACIDSLVTTTTGVGDGPALGVHGLRASPNPFRRETTVELSNAGRDGLPAHVTVHDVSGRRVATLWDGPARSGVTRVTWDGRSFGGAAMPAGVYVVRADLGGARLVRRIIHVQ